MIFQHRRQAAFFDNESLMLLQRAYEGACWSVGVPPHPRGEPEAPDTRIMRDQLAKAVMGCAGRGNREVQHIKANALRALGGKHGVH